MNWGNPIGPYEYNKQVHSYTLLCVDVVRFSSILIIPIYINLSDVTHA